MSDKNKAMLAKITEFLEEFEWKPESIEEKDNQYTIVLTAQLDIREIKIKIKFSESSHWIFFSALFIANCDTNQEEVYKKLLEINYSTTLTKFGLSSSGGIYALSELPAQTMDYEEFVSALRRLTNDINKYLLPVANLLRKNGED